MPLDNGQQKWLPLGLNTPPQDIPTGSSCPVTPSPELGKVYAAQHQFRRYLQPPPFQALLSAYGKQASCLNGPSDCDAAPERALKSCQKRFLVFDQSGNQTRLLQCGFPSSLAAADPGKILSFLNLERGLSKDHAAIPEKILLHEDRVNGGEESEMHEDTEEINALLYSDDDDDCESNDDEVTSTGHSPFPVEQQACNNKTEEEDEEEPDETESYDDDDDGPRLKRQKVLLDHYSHRDLSPSSSVAVGTKKSFTNLKGLSDEKLQESNISSSNQEMGSGLSDEETRKDKFHTALRILESVVPGAKGKEALLLLDEAIDYLKLLKRNLTSPKCLNNHW